MTVGKGVVEGSWVAEGATGIVVALRQMVLAAGMIVLTLFVLTVFRKIEIWLKTKGHKHRQEEN